MKDFRICLIVQMQRFSAQDDISVRLFQQPATQLSARRGGSCRLLQNRASSSVAQTGCLRLRLFVSPSGPPWTVSHPRA